MNDRRRHLGLLAIILFCGAVLRLQGLDWDEGQHLHPDERFLTMVGTALAFPDSLAGYFDTATSPLNPANRGHRFFVYGTFPIFLVRAVSAGLGLADYEHFHLVGRVLAALADLGTVAATAILGTLLAGSVGGLAAAALSATTVLAIQQAHFFTVDSFAGCFATLAMVAIVRVTAGAGLTAHLGFAVSLGLALACRVNLAPLAGLYPLALAVAAHRRSRRLWTLALFAIATGLATALVFRIAQPYAFAGPGFFGMRIAPDFLGSLATIRSFVTGAADYPPGVQWIGRTPVLFAARNLFFWGLGPPFALAALLGSSWLVRRGSSGAAPAGAGRILVLWAAGLFLYHSVQFAATGRYFLPIVPVLAVAAAGFLLAGGRARRIALVLLLVASSFWAIAFTAIYRRPHSRVEASRWIYANVPPDSFIASEHWDDALPLAVDGKVPTIYQRAELELYAEDTPAKRERLVERLTEAEVLVLSSNRLYRSIPRAPWRYPLGRLYYELLFAGTLGFRLEQVVTSFPRLGPFEIPDAEAEEAFTVYDHPKVLIFRKTEAFSRERVERLLGAAPLDAIVRVSPVEAGALYRRSQPSDVPLPGEEKVRSAVAAPEGGSIVAMLRWLAGFEIVSAAFFVLLAVPFARLPDRGLSFARIIAWLAPGTVAWLGGALGFGANQPGSLRGFVVVALLGAAVVVARRGRELARSLAAARSEIFFVECLFLGGFALFAALRALNPAIFWGEKPMDFAILNACLRSRSMPPADPWWAGETLNYYYYGHEVVAAFAALTDTAPAFAFNLAITTTGALVLLAAYAAGRLLGGRASGLLAAGAAGLIGNLEGVRLWLADPGRRFDFDTYWATTRLWTGSINEYPWWNLLFGDLHSHVIAQPLSLALVALATLWVAEDDGTRRAPRSLLFALVAWLGGALAVTSTWSAPVAFAAQLALLLTDAWRSPRRTSALAFAAFIWIGLVIVSRLLYLPFWATYRTPSFGWGFETEAAPLGAVLRYFGVFLVVLVPALALAIGGAARRRMAVAAIAVLSMIAAIVALGIVRSPAAALFATLAVLALAAWAVETERGARCAAALVFVAAAVGVGTEIVFVSDRMNTVFKFYLEMWLLLAVAAGALLAHALAWAGRVGRFVLVLPVAAAVLAGFFTSVTGAIGWARSPFVPSPIPTLDGMAYLQRVRPRELEAYRWLNREVAGVPVLLEAQGPSYQEYSRVSMNTGLPTVLGWEWHLMQQAHDRDRVEERKADVREMYSTGTSATADVLLRKYGVALVFVGPLERRTYPADGLAKFDQPGWLDVVYRNQDVTIYGRPGAVDAARTWIEPERVIQPRREVPLGRMREPRDLATAPDGTVVIADFGHRRIQRLNADGRALAAFGHEGDLPGEFRDPCGVAVGADGRIFVADTWNHRIQVFGAEGAPIAQWGAGFYGPRGVALAADGTAFVTDTGNRTVVHLGPSGRVVARFGAEILQSPVGIAIDGQGDLWVADAGRREVVIFDSSGRNLRSFAVDGWMPGGVVEPYLEIGKDGVVWLTDPPGGRVLLYDRDGRRLGEAVPDAPLSLPLGIALLDDRRALVSSADGIVKVERR